MKVVTSQMSTVLTPISEGGVYELTQIENAARDAYKSTNIDNFEKTKQFVASLIKRGHESPLEHSIMTVKFLTDRGVANEIVRHRLAAYTQESTRYCNYSKDKFGSEISVVMPIGFDNPDNLKKFDYWYRSCNVAEQYYMDLLHEGATPEEARAVLPLSLATTITVSTNYREWRHIFKLRTAKDAHPQIRELMGTLLSNIKTKIPVIFDDIPSDEWDGKGVELNEPND